MLRVGIWAVWCLLFFALFDSSSAKKITIIHTTDVHGWVSGHPHNSSLDADFGDFLSLLTHLKEDAKKNKEEFFLFDTGDLIEGTGLSDASDIRGEYIFDIVADVATYDALTMGNHDIGHPEVVDFMKVNFIPRWKAYLTANSVLKATNGFIGQPYTVFTTELGTTVLVLGYMFNFTHEANNTVVNPVSVSLAQPYFQKAMTVPNVDLIVVCSHIAPQNPVELTQIYKAIRSYHRSTPLVLLSGHSHLTYFQQYDENCFVFESGKYFEVIGLIRFEIENAAIHSLQTSWETTSVQNFARVSVKSAADFPTPGGAKTKSIIHEYEQKLGLDITYGCSPTTYYPDIPFSDPTNLYKLVVENVVPRIVFNNSDGNTQFYLANTQSLRYALFEGKVTRNDIYTISPFNDTFVYFQGIKGNLLKTLLTAIANTTGLTGDRCIGYHRTSTDPDPIPNWYYSTFLISDSTIYDLVTATYDATTILPVLKKVIPNQHGQQSYPTKYNSTAALQAYIEKYFKCS